MIRLAPTRRVEKHLLRVRKKQKKARAQRLAMFCGTPACNRRLGMWLAAKAGWDAIQLRCLDVLWGAKESGWSHTADNPTSDAYGIPQALPGSKMGPGWQSDPQVQIRWGLRYVVGRFGSACAALNFRLRVGWY